MEPQPDSTLTSDTHTYTPLAVPVEGGTMHGAVWEPTGDTHATILAIHGVTSSHLAWPWLVCRLPGIRVVAPDLRGRGRSNRIAGPAGMRAHATDMVAVLDHVGLAQAQIVGHSMGGFVSTVLTHLYPERVRTLTLIDGGLPLPAPTDIPPAELTQMILGPTANRLSMHFADEAAYFDFWRKQPAIANAWNPCVENYLRYDLEPDDQSGYKPATSIDIVEQDTADLVCGSDVEAAVSDLNGGLFITVPLGLQAEPPGLYPSDLAESYAHKHSLQHVRVDGFNHYTIVMSDTGAEILASHIADNIC